MEWVPAAAALMPHRTRALNAQSNKIINKRRKIIFMGLFCPMSGWLFLQRRDHFGGHIGDDGGCTAGDECTRFFGIVNGPDIAFQT